MLEIRLIQHAGHAPSVPIQQVFDERGGTIGREDSNTLALPDPDRHISRMQAQVRFENGRYLLIDHGSNPSAVNGRPLGKGASIPLTDGDEIQMADFLMRVSIRLQPPSLQAAPDPTGHAPFSASPTPVSSDPLGLFGASSAHGDTRTEATDPFAAIPPETHRAQPLSQTTAAPAPPGGRDDDPFAVFAGTGSKDRAASQSIARPDTDPDPFAALAHPNVASDPFQAPTPATRQASLTDLARPVQDSSLDALFGLSESSGTKDPFAGTQLDAYPAPLSTPGASGSDDPLALLGGASHGSGGFATTGRNDSPILNDAFAPPTATDVPESPAETRTPSTTARVETAPDPLQAPPVPTSTPFGAPAAGVVSWSSERLSDPLPAPVSSPPPARVSVELSAHPQHPAAPATAIDPVQTQGTPEHSMSGERVRVTGLEAPSAPREDNPVSAGGSGDLMAAFARGAGLANFNPPGGLTPAFMEQMGHMLREAVQGTMELLVARAATKREVRADVTMIVSKNNNPLKFSPDPDFALMQMLSPHGTGFMAPDVAMQDAYDDLRAHQIGFMAGMKAALNSLLNRFTPAELEARLSSKSFLDSVMPANRKARLWDLYEQRHEDIKREAEDDFHALFGKEFLRAYEAQIDALHDARHSDQ